MPSHRAPKRPRGGRALAVRIALVLALAVAVGGGFVATEALRPASDPRVGSEAAPGPVADLPTPSSSARELPRFKVVAAGAALERRPRHADGDGTDERSDLAGKAERAALRPTDPFVVSSFNILGSQHTRGTRWAPGTARAGMAASLIANRGVSIVGFSELQRDQLAVLEGRLPNFDFYPGTALGSKGIPTSIGWNTTVWKAVDFETFTIVFSSQQRPQPVVRLRHVETGREILVVNVHNSPRSMQAQRDAARAIEIAKINELAESTGLPIVLTGDFNEKERAFCAFTGSTPLESAVGGSNDGACRLPANAKIDWIFASPEIVRHSYDVSRAAPVPAITDHSVMFAALSLP